MSVSIVEKPFLFDFARNFVRFSLIGTPTAATGRKAVTYYKINTMPRVNHTLLLSYGKKSFTFTVRNIALDTFEIYSYSAQSQIKTELETKIAKNYHIARDFDVSVSNTLEIIFTAKDNGGDTVNLQSNDPSANIQLISRTTGIERTEKTGYRIFARLEVTRTLNGVARTSQTPEILLHVDINDRVSLPLTLLRSYFAAVDIPGLNESFTAYSLKYALLKYRLAFTDYFNGFVQILQYSDENYLVNAEISESCRTLNQPDWFCPMGGSNKLSSFARPRSYGLPSGQTLKSYSEFPQYAYFMLFNSASDSNYKSTLEVRVDILNENGSVIHDINPGTVTLSNFSIVRIPLSVKALKLNNHSAQILSYTVRIYNTAAPTAVWTRTFVMQEKPFFAKEFLLQNKYGFLESFFVDNEMTEKTVDGEQVIRAGRIEIDITDVSTIYTARTGYKSDIEMKLLSEAIENRFHYKIVNNTTVPIVILPDTLTVLDEAEDLQAAEFQYCFTIPETQSDGRFLIDSIREQMDRWNDRVAWMDANIFDTLNNRIMVIQHNQLAGAELIENGMELGRVRDILNSVIARQEMFLLDGSFPDFVSQMLQRTEQAIQSANFNLEIEQGSRATLQMFTANIVRVDAFRLLEHENEMYEQPLRIAYRVERENNFQNLTVLNMDTHKVSHVRVQFNTLQSNGLLQLLQ